MLSALREADGILDPSIAVTAFFSRRFSSPDDLNTRLENLMYLTRKDFPSLEKRETHVFLSDGNALRGYLYRHPTPKGLVLFVHGIKGQADDLYAIGQDALLQAGYSVFVIELTASGQSEGKGISGLQQSAFDVAMAVRHIHDDSYMSSLPLFLFGHSWGAYGVAASLNLISGVKAVAAVSGFDTPLKEMMALPEEKIGIPMERSKDALIVAMRKRAGEDYDLSASQGIESSGVPTLLIHGDEDHTVPLKGASTFDNCSAPNAVHLLRKAGHIDIFFAPMARVYALRVRELAKNMLGKDIGKATPKQIQAFRASFDPHMTSVLDQELFSSIDAFFVGNA